MAQSKTFIIIFILDINQSFFYSLIFLVMVDMKNPSAITETSPYSFGNFHKFP